MKQTVATACVLMIVSGGLLAWQSAPQSSNVRKTPPVKKTSARKVKKPLAKAAAPAPLPAQEMPPVPATLMNSPKVKPSVTLEGGLLTIDAPNSTLSDVLSEVHKATGASIEGANPTERIAIKLGPGNPEQVLAALLRGTPYDYVILGAPGKSNSLTRVMLSQQSSPGSPGTPEASRKAPPSSEDDGEVVSPRQPAAAGNQPSEDSAAPENAEPEQPQAQPPEANQQKTPEQLFKELQQLNQPKPPTQQNQQPQQ